MGALEGKVAIVTGATGGIGRATTELFAREGAAVLMVDRDEGALRAAAEQIGGERIAYVAADVSDEAQTNAYVQRAVTQFGGLDVLFANAGIEGAVAPIASYPIADFDRVLAVNVRGPFLGMRAAIPHLVARKRGSIIVTSSIAGLRGFSGLSAYVASKHATIGLVRTAASELGPLGIRVNTINPGPIENRMMRSIEDQASPGHADQVKHGFESKVPLGRYGTNDEIARLALFLASDASSYCSGGVFVADGGFVAQ